MLGRRDSRKGGRPRQFFALTATDLTLDVKGQFRPHKLVLVIKRNRDKFTSQPLEWEPSLKSPQSGFAFLAPELKAVISTGSQAEGSYKDFYITLHHQGSSRGAAKVLAKAKFNLLDYRDLSETRNARLRLLPESAKVAKCHVNVQIQVLGSDPQVPVELVPPAVEDICSIYSQDELARDSRSRTLSERASASLASLTPPRTRPPPSHSRSTLEDEAEDASSSASSHTAPWTLPRPARSESRILSPAAPPVAVPSVERPASVVSEADDESRRLAWPKVLAVSVMSSSSPAAKVSPAAGPLGWAQSILRAHYPQIKVTNLSTSWRNGVAFCFLLHHSSPELIPVDQIDASAPEENFSLLFDALQLLEVPLSDSVLKCEPSQYSNDTVKQLLNQLQELCRQPQSEAIPASRVTQHQLKWQDLAGFFPHVSKPKSFSPQAEVPPTPDTPAPSESPDVKVKDRVQSLIIQAHQLHEAQAVQSPIPVVESLPDSGSQRLMGELKSLDTDISRINSELEHLERVLRESGDNTGLPSLIRLVNEKNGLVRKQMQYNILLKQAQLDTEQQRLASRLHVLCSLSDEQKTEVMKEEESKLFNRHIALVNEKNELVHHLDSQEQAIQEDEEIQEFLQANPQEIQKIKKEDCVIQ